MKTIEQVREYCEERYKIFLATHEYTKCPEDLRAALLYYGLLNFINQEDEDNDKPAPNI